LYGEAAALLSHTLVCAPYLKVNRRGIFFPDYHQANLIEREKVTVSAGVPTIWMGVIGELAGRCV
jgi:hypothetical protein